MSSTKGKKITHRGNVIEYNGPVPSDRTEKAVRNAIEADLLKFEGHKKALLTVLRGARKPKSASKAFQEGKWWLRLINLAYIFYWEARVKDETMPSGDRAKRLHILARALGKARSLTNEAMGHEFGGNLFSAWQEEISEPPVSVVRNADGSLALLQNAEKMFKKQVAGLAALEIAAQKAGDAARRERVGGGRPKGTALPAAYILALADFYRKSTATKRATGDGSFPKFVRTFLDAVGQQGRITERHLIGMIDDAFVQARKSPAARHPSK
jgi:hypothetical protein